MKQLIVACQFICSALLFGVNAHAAWDVSIVGSGASSNGTWVGNDWVPSGHGSQVTTSDLMAHLDNGPVVVNTAGAGGEAGDITIAATFYFQNTKLTLAAQRNIYFQQNVQQYAGTLALEYGQGALAAGNTAEYILSRNVRIDMPAGNSFFTTRQGSDGLVTNYTLLYQLGLPANFIGLNGLRNDMSGKYVLAIDIDAADTATWNGGAGFAPNGEFGAGGKFNGVLDGLGHTINKLTANKPDGNAGLFDTIGAPGIVRHLGFVDADITALDAGPLAAYNEGLVTDVFSTGSVKNVSAAVHVGTLHTAGGLVGFNRGRIRHSYSSATVNGSEFLGGLVAYNVGSIAASYASGSVTGTANYVGGLVGYHTSDAQSTGVIDDSYATGNVSSTGDDVGGLVGRNASTINTSYATGSASGTNNVGRLVGYNPGFVNNSNWDDSSAGPGFGSGVGTNSTMLTALQMKQLASFNTWDIDADGGTGKVWRIYEGNSAPLLRRILAPLHLAATTAVYNGLAQQGAASPAAGGPSTGVNVGSYTHNFYSDQMGFDVFGGGLTIAPAALTIKANNQTKPYDGIPYAGGNGVTYTGMVNSEDPVVVLGGTLVYGGNAQGATAETTYAITPGGLTSSNYAISFADGVLTILKLQTISFPPLTNFSWDGGSAPLAATASSGLSISYSVLSGPCTINGSSVMPLFMYIPGDCVIAANQPGNAVYNLAAQVTQAVSVTKAVQTIQFATLPSFGWDESPLLSASSNSLDSLTFSVLSGPCQVLGNNTVRATAVGSCTFAADQAGNTAYAPAPQATQTVAVTKAKQSLTFIHTAPFAWDTGWTILSAYSTSHLTITYAVQSGPCAVNDDVLTATNGGTCVITANQPGNSQYLPGLQVTDTVTVEGAAQAITFPGIISFVWNTESAPLIASSSSLLPVTFSVQSGPCVVNGTTLTATGGGTCFVNAIQVGNTTYAPAQVTRQVTVRQASQTITFPLVPAFGWFAESATLAATASSGLPVTYLVEEGPCTINGLTLTGSSLGFCVIKATQAGDANYRNTFTYEGTALIPSAQSINFPPIAGFAWSGGSATLAATATSGFPVTYGVLSGPCSIAGNTVTASAGGTCSIGANQFGDNDKFGSAPAVAQTVTVNAIAQTVIFTPASPVEFAVNGSIPLSATASSGLTAFTYSTSSSAAICTVAGSVMVTTGPGTCVVTATQAGNASYTSASATAGIAVVVNLQTTYIGPTATGSGTAIAVQSGGGPNCAFVSPQFIAVSGNAASPPAGTAPINVAFLHGLFDFSLSNCTPGATVTLAVYYPTALPDGTVYWKYGPTPGTPAKHWYVLPATIAGNSATFPIADGGFGDDDLAANGTIVDQGGPGVPAPSEPTAIPTLSEWALLLLAGLMGMFGAGALRRRQG